ncbi:MAG: hypothetical protein NTV49_11310 [Kiritimatiellaeota bacterium]|nr:hypothetical protein [Kiritimatiellota bacterium]
MKKYLAVLWLAATLTASAGTASILSGDENWRMNFRPEFQFSKVGGEFAGLAGAQLGVSLQRSFYIGAAGYGLVNSLETQGPASRLSALDFWYAGGFLDVTLFANQTVHGSFNTVFAGGRVKPGGAESANVFVASPGVTLQVKLAPLVELGVGAGYRFVSGSDLPTDSELSKPWCSIFLRFNESL